MTDAFTPFDQRTFAPIDDAARVVGKRQIVRRGDWYAAGEWTGEFWAYPPMMEGGAFVQLDFEPTEYEVRP